MAGDNYIVTVRDNKTGELRLAEKFSTPTVGASTNGVKSTPNADGGRDTQYWTGTVIDAKKAGK
jgi:hypothetical protein